MAILTFYTLFTLAAGALATLLPDTHLHRRDGNEPYPFCTTATNPSCVNSGRYVKPDLNISDAGSPGDNAYVTLLPSHTFTTSLWTNQKMPPMCYSVINHYGFRPVDFQVYNVTYSDCPTSPWVICRSINASPTLSQIATNLSKMPASMRQAANAYLVFSESWDRAIESWWEDGLIAGKGSFYGPGALVHEHGHAVDGYLLFPSIPGVYSGTSAWLNVVSQDGYSPTAYGTTSHAENFADIGRVVLIENIYPGGINAMFPNHPNLTRIANQVAHFQSVAGAYYQAGTTCDLSKKHPFPSGLVDVPTTTPTPTNTATATPYGQCGGATTYTGPTACGPGWSCTTLNPWYAQCTPAP
ncbi:hypothetical protein B0T14DRAFT_498749 [Immersiella caudata]|uniref:CBM1 domain-containing protein n=1 Tax=Immersiella caudata TaxID=314043 RepID=A0AA39U837_9PEZI|nr:hypothetical protein B0T14DRAFT_498749 [Immersiella caudata]